MISKNSCNQVGEDILGCLVKYANDVTFSTSFSSGTIFHFTVDVTPFVPCICITTRSRNTLTFLQNHNFQLDNLGFTAMTQMVRKIKMLSKQSEDNLGLTAMIENAVIIKRLTKQRK